MAVKSQKSNDPEQLSGCDDDDFLTTTTFSQCSFLQDSVLNASNEYKYYLLIKKGTNKADELGLPAPCTFKKGNWDLAT